MSLTINEIGEKLRSVNYISTEQINTTVFLAMKLKKSILIEGPAGVGKTSLATSLAKALNRRLIRIQCYEGISLEQVLGEFNYSRQLLTIELVKSGLLDDPEVQKTIFSEDFFIKRPLLEAFASKEDIILLIDEIDKSDAEFESFLLEALGERQITIPELKTFHGQNDILVIMTSNAERMLSEPLKRRCLHLYLDFPSKEREIDILKIHAPSVSTLLLKQVVHVIHEFRKVDLRKLPSISESFEWLNALLALNIEKLDRAAIRTTLNVVLKYQEDLKRVNSMLNEVLLSLPSKDEVE